MTFQVIPRERGFFDLLEQASAGVATGARELRALVSDLCTAPERCARIQELEHDGDDLTHKIMSLLATTFVTPVDRPDIVRLASDLDDVLDCQEAVADLLLLHKIEEPLEGLVSQADVLARITEATAHAVKSLRWIGDGPSSWPEITRLEREGDRVYRRAVADLYSTGTKPMVVLKWKDILDEMETAVDRCEDVANTLESIALKHD